jgi:microsomal dipeptidase-like Zn-dependent dipeptidase
MVLGLKVKIMEKDLKINQGFPKQPEWFEDARGFKNIENGLKKIGFSDSETQGILGNNWYNFYKSI